jgi:head-tail adaptor
MLNRAERDAIVDAARRYVSAWHAVRGADSREFAGAAADHADAFHALAVAVDRTCEICEPGTCPIAPHAVDVIDQGGRI